MDNQASFVSPDQYPFLHGLQEIGMYARLINDRINIGPRELVTPDILQIAKEHRDAIHAELIGIMRENAATVAYSVQPLPSRYSDHNHNLDDLHEEWCVAYELAAELYNRGNVQPFWNGDENAVPPVPFYWVWDCKLNNPSRNDYEYRYVMMFRDEHNCDSAVIAMDVRKRVSRMLESNESNEQMPEALKR